MRHLLRGQLQHLLFVVLLVPGLYALARPGLSGGVAFGISDQRWLLLMVIVVLTHQIIVAAVFRLQLAFSLMTRLFGSRDMIVWGSVFLPLLILRVITLVGLAHASSGSMAIPWWIANPLAVILIVPALYTLYSVFRYFGLGRALGGDHFRESYRTMPFEARGMFRYSSNAMYSFAFLLLWAIALVTQSRAALAAAAFQHAYIWVHWYCTEAPDIEVLFPKK